MAADRDSLSKVIRARGGSKGGNLWSQSKVSRSALRGRETVVVYILSFCQPKKKGSLSPSVTKEHTQVSKRFSKKRKSNNLRKCLRS